MGTCFGWYCLRGRPEITLAQKKGGRKRTEYDEVSRVGGHLTNTYCLFFKLSGRVVMTFPCFTYLQPFTFKITHL